MRDTLSDVLQAIRLSGAVFFKIDATTPWAAEAPAAATIAPFVMRGVEHVMEYHIITQGTGWGGVVGERAVELAPGDVLVFPRGDAHVISSAPGMRGRPDADVFRMAGERRVPLALSLEGGGAQQAQIVCGFLGCDARPFNPLLAALPRMIHLRAIEGDCLPGLAALAVAESTSSRPGGDGVLSKLSELLFVEGICRYVTQLPEESTGWFAGLRDDRIGRALRRLHEQPARDWSLEQLGKECGLSRSAVAERFCSLVGITPMEYLARWRIQLAAALLRSGDASLAEIAERVGYGSDAALSRAFKRHVGVAPAYYRIAATSAHEPTSPRPSGPIKP